MKKFFAICLILVLLVSFSYATTYSNKTVSKEEWPGKIRYYGTVTCADTASGAIYYTQWFYIGASNYTYGWGDFQINEVGTEDVNVFIEYSGDFANGKVGATDSDLDALGTTQKFDTLGIAQGTVDPYNRYLWARLKFVLGSTNGGVGVATTPEVITWNTYWIKPVESLVNNRDFAKVKDDE